MTITCAQEPSGITYVAPITESTGPARSDGKRRRRIQVKDREGLDK
jgi:hypothetical protein